jgi:hypothetical protein
MSSSPGSDIVTVSPPISQDDLPPSLVPSPSNTDLEDRDAKEGVVHHIERAQALDVDNKPATMSVDTPTKRAMHQQQGKQRRVSDKEEDVRRKMEETVQNIKDKADR